MNTTIDAVVIDDHPVVARATMTMVEGLGFVRGVGIAYTGEEGLALVAKHRPGLIVLDDRLPDIPSAELAMRFREYCPESRIVWFAAGDVEAALGSMIDASVNGVLSKNCDVLSFQRVFGCILQGQTVFPDSLLQALLKEMRKPDPAALLNEQERTMMELLIQGYTHEQIAQHIHVSRRSVDNYLRKIYDKLGVASKLQAVEKLLSAGSFAKVGEPRH